MKNILVHNPKQTLNNRNVKTKEKSHSQIKYYFKKHTVIKTKNKSIKIIK